MINANIVRSKDFSWDFGVNASFIKNEVSGLYAPIRDWWITWTGYIQELRCKPSGMVYQSMHSGPGLMLVSTKLTVRLFILTGKCSAIREIQTLKRYWVSAPVSFYKKLSLVINMNGAFGQKIYNNTFNNVINVGNLNGGKNIAVSVYESDVTGGVRQIRLQHHPVYRR